jgi:hypothetical protein
MHPPYYSTPSFRFGYLVSTPALQDFSAQDFFSQTHARLTARNKNVGVQVSEYPVELHF